MKSFIFSVAPIALALLVNPPANAAPSPSSIVGNWHLDEGGGQATYDSSGRNKHGRLGSSKLADTRDPTWITRRFDTAALNFSGDKFVRVAHGNHLEPKKITVEAWIRPQKTVDATVLPYVLAKGGDGCAKAAYGLYVIADENHPEGGVPYFYVSNPDGYAASPVGAPNLWDGQWHHIVGSYDLKAVKMYVDGKQIGTGTPETRAIDYGNFTFKDLYIGDYDGDSDICTNYNGNFVGDIDEVRIWNRALTPAEVALRFKGY